MLYITHISHVHKLCSNSHGIVVFVYTIHLLNIILILDVEIAPYNILPGNDGSDPLPLENDTSDPLPPNHEI